MNSNAPPVWWTDTERLVYQQACGLRYPPPSERHFPLQGARPNMYLPFWWTYGRTCLSLPNFVLRHPSAIRPGAFYQPSIAHSARSSVSLVDMDERGGGSKKRQQVPSGGSESSRNRKAMKSNHQTESAQRVERGTGSGGTQSRGATRGQEECQWRREGREFKSAQAQRQAQSAPPQLVISKNSSGRTIQRWDPPGEQRRTMTQGGHHRAFSGPGCNPAACSNQASNSHAVSGSKSTLTKRLWFNVQPQPKGSSNRGRRQRRQQQSSSKGSGGKGGGGGGGGCSSFEFSVVSYNILAQGLLEDNNHLYRHCDQLFLPWPYRRHNLLEELKQADADVICLQEVEHIHFKAFIDPQLRKLGYESIYKRRTGDKNDGCATFYKMSSFHHIETSQLEYQRNMGCLDRDNVAVIVLLQPKTLSSSNLLCVANTHLLWNPRRGDIKLAQLGLLFAEMEHLAHIKTTTASNTYHPMVLCGDFNSVPHSPLYKFVKTGHVAYEGMAAVDVSGQEEGRARRPMQSPLWPHHIGVTSRCRYRHRETSSHAGSSANQPASHGENSNQSNNSASHENSAVGPKGMLSHPFIFSSTYDHTNGNREVTTSHSRTNCTVDYIFYTQGSLNHVLESSGQHCLGKERAEFTGNLSLVKRLSLFTDNEIRSMGGLPNEKWSSDHLSLQAVLRLTPIK